MFAEKKRKKKKKKESMHSFTAPVIEYKYTIIPHAVPVLCSKRSSYCVQFPLLFTKLLAYTNNYIAENFGFLIYLLKKIIIKAELAMIKYNE